MLVLKIVAFVMVYLFIGAIFAAWHKQSKHCCKTKTEEVKLMAFMLITWPITAMYLPFKLIWKFLCGVAMLVWAVTEQSKQKEE